MSERTFELSWSPTVADYETALRAKRRATRVVWFDRVVGALMVLVSIPGIVGADPVSILFVLFGVSVVTGLYGRTYRSLFYYRRNPSGFLPTHLTVASEGLRETDGQTDVRTDWSRYKAVLHLDDRLVLMTALGGNCGLMTLPRSALTDQTEWADLVRLVNAKVPDHPRDPHPRSNETTHRGVPS